MALIVTLIQLLPPQKMVILLFNITPMKRKLQKEVKFKIREQYGKYEFDLDWIG